MDRETDELSMHISDHEKPEVDFKEILIQLFARKYFIGAATLIGFLVGFLIALIAPDEYSASAVVQIEKRSDGLGLPTELIGNMFSGNNSMNSSFGTEVHVIKSRVILEPMAKKLGLMTEVSPVTLPIWGDFIHRHKLIPRLSNIDAVIPKKYARGDEFVEVGKLEFESDLKDWSLLLRSLGGGTFSVELQSEIFTGEIGEPLDLAGLGTLVVSSLEAPVGREFIITKLPTRKIVEKVSSNLRIEERSRSGIVDFTFTGKDPNSLVPILNEVIRTYQRSSLRRGYEDIDQSIAFISKQLPDLIAEAEIAQANMSAFRAENGGVGELSRSTKDILSRLLELESQEERLTYEAEELLKRITPKHPDYIDLVNQLNRIRLKISDEKIALASVPLAEQEFAQLTRELERALNIELQLTDRIEQLKILKASKVSNVRLLEPAEVYVRVGPNRLVPLALIVLSFVLCASFYVLLRNYFRTGIEDAQVLEQLGIPLFGTISKVKNISGGSRDTNYLIAHIKPDEPVVEAFRGLRTALGFTITPQHENSAILITSCAPGDGKSFISSNIAAIMGMQNNRTLIIDADMRRGKLRHVFGLSRETLGISDILTGRCSPEQATFSTAIEGLSVIPTGKRPPNPAELLEGPNLELLMAWANSNFDFVIVDAPPVLAVADPLILSKFTSVKLLVARHLQTAEAEIISVHRLLENNGIKLSGAIINAYDQRSSKYGSYDNNYGHQYGRYHYSYTKD